MNIKINYTLKTDGVYTFTNDPKFGCIGENVIVNDHEYIKNNESYYDYMCCVEFKNEDPVYCKREAVDFLWKLLCDGIHISWEKPSAIKEFYDLMYSLQSAILSFGVLNKEEQISVTRRGISCSYYTNFEVIIYENSKK